MKSWIILLVALSFESRSQAAVASPHPPNPRAGHILFESAVPFEQAQALTNDLSKLSTFAFREADSSMLKLMGLKRIDQSSLLDWLEARVQYIVPETFDAQTRRLVVSPTFQYENANRSPVLEHATRKAGPGDRVKVVMSNKGVSTYFSGKKTGALYGFDLGDLGKVQLTSPRVGVLQIGSGLFSSKKGLEASGRTIYHLATLFHEARHSDGNGVSVGFFHAVCPPGHDYEGYTACDRNLNGPYTVGATLLKAMTEGCQQNQCTVAEKEALRLQYLNNFNRVIRSTPSTTQEAPIPSVAWDPRPEGRR